MTRILKFRHLTNTYKPLAGVDHSKCAPKIVETRKQVVDDNNKTIDVTETSFDPTTSPVEFVLLQSEEFRELTAAEKKYPEPRQRIIVARDEADYERRLSANEAIRVDFKRYEDQGEIEVLGEEDVDDKKAKFGIVSDLAQIKSEDFSARNVPVPAAVRNAQVTTPTQV